jgi:hypothetical protein
MNIQAEKLEIMKMILETDNPGILESIKNLFKKTATVDFWETLPQVQKDDILQGINDIENGDVVDYDDFMKKHSIGNEKNNSF